MYSCSDGAGETKDNLTNNSIITATSETKVMLVHNEHVVEEQPACGETLCSVEDFKAYYQHIVDFDWDTQCPVPEPENTTSTTEAGVNGTEVINIVNIINIVSGDGITEAGQTNFGDNHHHHHEENAGGKDSDEDDSDEDDSDEDNSDEDHSDEEDSDEDDSSEEEKDRDDKKCHKKGKC